MTKWVAALMAVVVLGVGLTAIKMRTVAAAPPPQQPLGFEPDLDEFWRRWEGDKPSSAIRHAALTPELERAWEPIGRAADDFQNRAGGKCLGHSEITRKPLGDRMEYLAFYALYEPTPIRVQILYYASKDKWTAISLRVDSIPSRWLEEASQPQAQVIEPPAQPGQ